MTNPVRFPEPDDAPVSNLDLVREAVAEAEQQLANVRGTDEEPSATKCLAEWREQLAMLEDTGTGDEYMQQHDEAAELLAAGARIMALDTSDIAPLRRVRMVHQQ